MINKKNISILIICSMILTCLAKTVESRIEVYPHAISTTIQYDDNVTREKLQKDYQYGIVWWLNTGFGIKNFIPVKDLDAKADYALKMRDVNTTNDEDFSSHNISLSSRIKIRTGTSISLKEVFELKNSQNDLFNFYDNRVTVNILQPFGEKTIATVSYTNERKQFQNNAPEVRARNFFYHQIGTEMSHKIADDFKVWLGYVHQYSTYNRSPIEFRSGRPVALDGAQRDRRNAVTLGFRAMLFNYTNLQLATHVLKSSSNSHAFNFSGNRTTIFLAVRPTTKLSLWFDYQIVGYDLEAGQTQDMGYELSEIRIEDQSYIKFGATYDMSPQVSLGFDYAHIENTARFPGESYKENTFSAGLRIKF